MGSWAASLWAAKDIDRCGVREYSPSLPPPLTHAPTCDVDGHRGLVADSVEGAACEEAAHDELMQAALVGVPVRLAWGGEGGRQGSGMQESRERARKGGKMGNERRWLQLHGGE